MCRAIQCTQCGKTTWAGCGRHVDDVMKDVPVARRCTCERKERSAAKTLAKMFASLRGR